MNHRTLRVAAAQYPLTAFGSLDDYEAKITRWVEEAVGQGSELLVFPEYGSMELCSIGDRGRDLQNSIDAVSNLVPEIIRVHGNLARKHRVIIVAGSGPQRRSLGVTANVAHIFGPSGMMGSYDKIMLTPWERDPWKIAAGRTVRLFDIGKAKIGLLICYDIEFPLLSRALAEAGAEIILAPSNTETEWGYWRVRTGAVARALENQVYTVHSPVVGDASFCAACEQNQGAAGIFAPSDRGFPPGGILALGEMNQPRWVYATLDLELLQAVRTAGGVQTFRHWPEQPGAGPLPAAQVLDISGSP
ncbi:MAG: carbon-nitrogen hydrolase family protein [Alphaproteobacteria bacterium]|nr:carbon-nitrogen hydrolase family protein [Alphaproteobacteria bacterium]